MKPGIHDIPMKEYLQLAAFSSGIAHKALTYSPYHARFDQEHGSGEGSSEADIGTAIHDILLEGRNRIVAVDAPDWRTKAAKEERDAARAEGKIPLLAHKVEAIEAAVASARAHIERSEIAGIFNSAGPERTIVWNDEGVLCKARADWLSDQWHLSVKTTDGSANPAAYTRVKMGQNGHDTALAFYKRGMEAHGIQVEHRIIVIEQNPPYACCVFGLAPDRWDLAERRAARAIALWRIAEQTGRFPAYPLETCFAEANPWEMEAEEMARLEQEAS